MPSLAYAQTGGTPAGPGPLVSVMPIVLMFVILYFLLIRPQQKKAREHETMVRNLKRNDEIVTTGGLYGRIQGLADAVLTVEIAPNVRVRIDRAQVASVVSGSRDKGKDD
jgi:preprotein translocase subunit YajC